VACVDDSPQLQLPLGRGPAPGQDRSAKQSGRRRASPGTVPRPHPPCRRNLPRRTRPLPTTTGWRERQMPRRQQPAPPPRDTAKMSPRINIGPDPVLAAHDPSPPAADRHCLASEVSAPHCGTELFFFITKCRSLHPHPRDDCDQHQLHPHVRRRTHFHRVVKHDHV